LFISIFWISIFVSPQSIYGQDRKIPSEKPKLVIGLVVSEMRYDYLNRYWGKFGEGGFKRLVSNGTFCKNAHHDYLISESATGFATISTGAYPDGHGIVSDFWYDRLKDEIVYSIFDENANTLGGAYESGQFSPVNIQSSTLSDEVKISNKFLSKVVSVSLDPRAAVISGGHTADIALWYNDKGGNWISSSYYVDSLPVWVEEFNQKKIADIYLDKSWDPLYPVAEYEESLDDNNDFETGIKGRKTFPYNLAELSQIKRKDKDYEVLKYTPFGNTFTRDMAVAATIAEGLGKDEYTDFLYLNFAATSFAGEYFNSWSVEMQDIYLRLDKEIEHLLNFIDQEIGLKNVLLYLTAENAAANEPSYLLEQKIPSGYFNYNSALTLLRTYLNVVYGKGDWIRFYYAQQIYLNSLLIEDSKISITEFEDRVARFMVQFEGVDKVLTSNDLMKNNYTRGTFEKIQKTYNQKRSGDIILHLSPGWIEKGVDRMHASSFHFNSHVPLIWYGWKIGRDEISRQISVTDIMPTINYFLNLSISPAMQGNIIQELVE
jgi:predicted AlkP superfamily pyrophosphatase or phosphodiesterase